MSYLDKTFCASPNCKNDCGRQMTEQEHQRLIYLNVEPVRYEYFCGEDTSSSEECQHEYKKTIAKSGMYFIDMCHKCLDEKPHIPPEWT